MRFLTFVFPGCKKHLVFSFFHFLMKNLVFWAILLAKNSKNTEKNVENLAFLGAETGGLEAGGLEAGGLEAAPTDFGSGIVLTRPKETI